MPRRPDELGPVGPVGYERHHASVGLILLAGLALAVLVGVVQAVTWGLHDKLRTATSALAVDGAPPLYRVPPEPRLQGSPVDRSLGQQQMAEVVRADSARLDRYGWVDRQGGLVHVPVDRAMALVATSGLPDWPASAAAPAAPAPPPPVIHGAGPKALRYGSPQRSGPPAIDAFYGMGGLGPGARWQAAEHDPERAGPGAVVLPALRVVSLLTVAALVLLIAWLLRHDRRAAGQAGRP